MTLIYVGDGRYVRGVPTTDLSKDDLAALAAKLGKSSAKLQADLVGSGLYVTPKASAPAVEK